MAGKPSTRRERAPAQRPAPGAGREALARPPAARGQGRPPAIQVLLRHLLWFLPLYVGLASAGYLLRTFYSHNFQDPRLMMGSLASATLGLLLEYPWARVLGRWGSRGGVPAEPAKGPARSRP